MATPFRNNKFALLIGCREYENSQFKQLRAPGNDVRALAEVLSDPEIGNFQKEVLLETPTHVLREHIEGFFADADRGDVLLAYFSCHGITRNGKLYFAGIDTKPDRLEATAISASFVNDQMEASVARRKVLLLDCCFSGAFAKGFRSKGESDASVEASFSAVRDRGTFVMTASTEYEYAWEGSHLADSNSHPSVFTSSLVQGLRTGDADRTHSGSISVWDLYHYVHDSVRRRMPAQNPRLYASAQGDLAIATSRWSKAEWSWDLVSLAAFADKSRSLEVDLMNLEVGQEVWIVMRLKNTGTETWFRTAEGTRYAVKLATSKPRDRWSRFMLDWEKPDRPCGPTEDAVGPGDIGTFEFGMQMSHGAGVWSECFNLVAEFLQWFTNTDIVLSFAVNDVS